MVNTKQFYVQIFGEQKHLTPDPASLKISTKEYFERDKDVSIANVSSKVTILETKYHIIKLFPVRTATRPFSVLPGTRRTTTSLPRARRRYFESRADGECRKKTAKAKV